MIIMVLSWSAYESYGVYDFMFWNRNVHSFIKKMAILVTSDIEDAVAFHIHNR